MPYAILNVDSEWKNTVDKFMEKLKAKGVPVRGVVALDVPEVPILGANVVVVVDGDPGPWTESVIEAKLELDDELGGTMLLPVAVRSDDPRIRSFLLPHSDYIRPVCWRGVMKRFIERIRDSEVPLSRIYFTDSPEQLILGANAMVVVKERPADHLDRIIEAKLELDDELGETGLVPVVVREGDPREDLFRRARRS